ncbi:MAG: helix-hairpin-helix domain-containing protein, partial [Acidobacteria bacterium]|nr:helix-hairpin-helix domain-containing protein [Acidobacteriota bacterium]
LLCALFVAACSSGVEKAQSNNSASANAASNSAAAPAPSTTQPAGDAAKARLNVNTASEDELLKTIPGFGKRMAHEFEEYRPYRSIEQFRREIGKYVSPEQVAEYEKYIYVPIVANESDAATLRQIPGLDATEAESLIAGRPYLTREAFLSKLAEKVSASELVVAKTYVAN